MLWPNLVRSPKKGCSTILEHLVMDSISVSLSFYIIMKEIIGFLEFLEAGIPNIHWELLT